MRIPSFVLVLLCIGVVYVGTKGLLCVMYDFAAMMVRREEMRREEMRAKQEGVSTVAMSRNSQIKTAVFWCSIFCLGYLMFLTLRAH